MSTTTITADAEIKARRAYLARQAGQEVDQFAEAVLHARAAFGGGDAICLLSGK